MPTKPFTTHREIDVLLAIHVYPKPKINKQIKDVRYGLEYRGMAEKPRKPNHYSCILTLQDNSIIKFVNEKQVLEFVNR